MDDFVLKMTNFEYKNEHISKTKDRKNWKIYFSFNTKIPKSDYISKTKNHKNKKMYAKISVRSITIYITNLASFKENAHRGVQNASFGRPWRPNAI